VDSFENSITDEEKTRTLASVSERTLCDLGHYADNVMKRLATISKLDHDMSGRDFASQAVLKALNAERALRDGHAAIINGRIQLTRQARALPEICERYEAGLRHWDPTRHDLIGFLRLVILSDIRAWAKRQHPVDIRVGEDNRVAGESRDLSLEMIPAPENSPEENVAEAEIFAQFVRVLDSSELKIIANRILFGKASITDLMLEFGLTRSQVEKRIKKIVETAETLSGTNNSN
jgi:hypothetical protein